MLHLITDRNAGDHTELLKAMRRDRKRLFIDIFRWDLEHVNGEECDAFDDAYAEYLVLADDRGGHVASLRLLRTDRPHLLDTAFASLCDGPVPKGDKVREITRLCLPLRRRERVAARNILARAIIDYAAASGVSSYTAVCHAAFLSELFTAGWRCAPLGPLTGAAGAVEIAMTGETQDLFTEDMLAEDMLAEDWRCGAGAPRLAIAQMSRRSSRAA